MRPSYGILVAFFLLPTQQARPETVQLVALKDNTLYQDPAGGVSNGKGDYLFTGRTDQTESLSRRRLVLQFDLAGSIPRCAEVLSATLQLYMSRTSTSTTTVDLHRLLAGWGEGASDASGEEGAGAPAAPGDATWLHRSHNTVFWSAPGGDFHPTPTQSVNVVGIGSYTWASNAAMVADVQGWLDNPLSNFGWIAVGAEFIGQTPKRFTSREHPDVSSHPALIVEFTQSIPTVSAWGMVAAVLLIVSAGALLLRWRGPRTCPS